MAPETCRQGSEHQDEGAPLVWLAVRRLDSVPLRGADSLGDAVQARARGFHRQTDRRRFLAGRLMARSLVAGLLGVPETTVTARAHCPDPTCRYGNDGSHGEPRYFRNGQPVPLLVSFSRCGDWLAAAAAEIRRGDDPGVDCLGVDLEDAASPAFAGAGLEDVMATGAERAALAAVAEAGRPRLRAQLWVRKEAVLKAAGQGLRLDPRSVDALSGRHAGTRIYDVGPEELGFPPNLVLSFAVGMGTVSAGARSPSECGVTGGAGSEGDHFLQWPLPAGPLPDHGEEDERCDLQGQGKVGPVRQHTGPQEQKMGAVEG